MTLCNALHYTTPRKSQILWRVSESMASNRNEHTRTENVTSFSLSQRYLILSFLTARVGLCI